MRLQVGFSKEKLLEIVSGFDNPVLKMALGVFTPYIDSMSDEEFQEIIERVRELLCPDCPLRKGRG